MVKGREEDIPIGSAGGGHVLVGTITEHPPKNMRLSRIALLLIAIPFAWRFGPEVLTAAVGAIPVLGEMFSFLTPGSTDKSVGFYFQFVISVVVVWLLLWLAFKALGLVFGFALPTAQRFGGTQALRLTQWLFLQALIGVFVFSEVFYRRPSLVDIFFSFIWWIVFYAFVKAVAVGMYLPVLRLLERGRFGIGGSGRFAGLVEEWETRWKRPIKLGETDDSFLGNVKEKLTGNRVIRKGVENSLFMGRSLYSPALHISLKDDRHMLTIGGSRSGKGATVIIPNLLTYEGSVLCIDPKGTNAKVTAQRRRNMGQDVYIVDPFHIVSEKSDCVNPLDGLDPDSLSIREDLSVIADAIVVPAPGGSGKDPHWEDGARTVITGMLAQILTDMNYRIQAKGTDRAKGTDFKEIFPPPQLSMIRDLLALKQEDQLGLWVDMRRNEGAGGAARDAGSRIIRGIDTDEITNIISNADKHTEWLSYPSMRDILGSSTFKFSQLKEKPTTIYLVLPPEYLDVHRRFLRLFVNLALNQMPKGGRSKVPVLMILDEFLQLGKMNEVERAFRLLAGYNFTVWPFVQELAGLSDLYGGGVNAFLTNSRAVQVFGVNDSASLKYISEQIGERSLQYVMGAGDSMRVTPLRTPKEVSIEIERESGMQYVLRAGKPAMILKRVKYFEESGSTGSYAGTGIMTALSHLFAPFKGLYAQDPDYK